MTRAAVIATTCGALLVVSLQLAWWGVPPSFIDPPDDLPAELEQIAEAAARETEDLPSEAVNRYERDAFAYFEFRDTVWLVTGIAGFALGLGALAGWRFTKPLAVVTAALGLASAILIALVLISPPDYIGITNHFFEEIGGQGPFEIEYDAPFGREAGGWIGLSAALGVALGAVLVLRGLRS